MQNQTVAEIDLAALRANLRALAALAAPASLIVPVKADAYGHGAVLVARCLADEGVSRFAVVTLNEALELRAAGIAADVLVMGVVDPGRAAEAARAQVAVAIHGEEHARACEAAVRAEGNAPPLACHVKADTGMHRLGLACERAVDVAQHIAASPHMRLEGLMTHLSHAEEADLSVTHEQLAAFRQVVAALDARGLLPPLVHAANSAGLMRLADEARFTAARPGLAMYGISPCPAYTEHVALWPVMSVHTAIALVKDVAAGDGVSYCHTWHAARASRVAALPIGYADGYRRGLSNRGQVRVEGQLAPVVGNVCMDTTLVDVTGVPAARVGSRVTVLEADAASPLSAAALAAAVGTIPHEVLTGIGRRVARVAVDEG